MSTEFWRKIARAEIRKTKRPAGEAQETAIRTYCYAVNQTWILQVRDHLVLADGRRSEDFVVASAYLAKEDLYALQAGINRVVSEMELGEDPVLDFARMSDAMLLKMREREEADAAYLLKMREEADAADASFGDASHHATELRLAAIRDVLDRRARVVEDAHERERQRCQVDATAISALSSFIEQLVAVRDAAKEKLPSQGES